MGVADAHLLLSVYWMRTFIPEAHPQCNQFFVSRLLSLHALQCKLLL
jgi:hypothetical protein